MFSPLLPTVLLGLAVRHVAATGPIVQLENSKVTYRGVASGSIEHFHNIRYAHDTSGERRFAPPEPYLPPDDGGEIDATTPGPACPQSRPGMPPFFDATPHISEDCLHLRVSRPAGTTAADKLPVVVWLHGGGVVKGSAHDAHADPERLLALSAALGRPVVYVALNYRLTIFGFARLPVLKEQRSLNAGMRDQRAGFQWVRDHIAAFGGDPDRITAFGLSAGGTFISMHPLAYGGERGVPFSQIWAMSGPPGTALNVTSDVTEMHTLAVAEKLGCGAADGDSDDDDGKAVLQCLRAVPMEKLTEVAMDYSRENHPPAGLFTFIPSVDDDFIPDRHSVLYKSGRFVKGIPTVFGWAQDDGAMNAGPAPAFENEEAMKVPIQSFAHALTDEDYETLFSLYDAADFAEDVRNYEVRKAEPDPAAPVHYFRVSRILRDMLFACPSVDFGHEMSRQSRALDPAFPGVRLYDLNQSMLTPLFEGAGMPYLGVCHGSDTNYIFNGLFPEGDVSDNDQKLSVSMAASFINFAYTGSPINADDEGFDSWPEAFPEDEALRGEDESGPSRINLQLIGGPLGTGPCSLGQGSSHEAGQEAGSMQHPLVDNTEYGEMETAVLQARRKQLEREKLLERCAFLSTLAPKLGV
ncbi:hypothetical protein SLS62_009425 [Diatrype stigma]|uniref:Carboxylesterase type B domain-containing protein n=1 Tax=Diatrype stigma TaxID=117547 RepID=A0AAN9YKH3_9PEZI